MKEKKRRKIRSDERRRDNRKSSRELIENKTVSPQSVSEMLLQKKWITEKKLADAEKMVTDDKSLEDILLSRLYLTEKQIMEIKSKQEGIPVIDLFHVEIEDAVLELFTKKFAQEHKVFPFKKKKGHLLVAMVNPLNYAVTTELRLLTGLLIEPYYALESDIHLMITNKYPSDAVIDEWLQEGFTEANQAQEMNTQEIELESSPIVKLVQSLLVEAVDKKASDIHFDPQEDSMLVRIRLDGELIEINKLPKNIQATVISRLKIIASLDITENRLPQDGRAQVKVENKKVDLRVSILPTIYGEKIVIRILDQSAGLRSLEEFNFDNHVLSEIKRLLHQPHGLFLVTGPTGSGKSSTLYAALNELNNPNVNIITVEDPVEFQLKGVNQVQVNSNIGLDFASGLRSILRQDPNVVMVGEIRDSETAEIAIRASMTGHLVLSTLHTNDAISTINRLVDMGVDPFLISNSLSGVLSQRLVRTICEGCKKELKPTEDEIGFMKNYGLNPHELYVGQGCPQCGQTGYRGRMAIQELLVLSPEMRAVVGKSDETKQLEFLADKTNMKRLLNDGLDKVMQGYTTISEVLRVAVPD